MLKYLGGQAKSILNSAGSAPVPGMKGLGAQFGGAPQTANILATGLAWN